MKTILLYFHLFKDKEQLENVLIKQPPRKIQQPQPTEQTICGI
jgi:hypothetical protein